MNDLERRQLEVERRILRMIVAIDEEVRRSDMMLAGAEKLTKIYELVWNLPFYPPGSCHGAVQTPIIPNLSPIYSSSYQLANITTPTAPPQQGCGWSNYFTIATPKDPAVVWKYVVYMTQNGVKSEVLSITRVCGATGGSSWVINPASGYAKIPVVDAYNPVEFSSEFLLASEISSVFVENVTSNFRWHNAKNEIIGLRGYPWFDYPYWFIGGGLTATALPPPVTTPPVDHGSPTWSYGNCTVGGSDMFGIPGYPGGPKKPSLTISGDISPKNTLKTVRCKFRVTLTDAVARKKMTGTAEPEVREMSFQAVKAVCETFKGTSTTFGTDGDQCINFTMNSTSQVDKPVGYCNQIYRAMGGGLTGISGGRWAKDIQQVGLTSCDKPPTIYRTIPPDVSLGRPADTGGMGGVFVPKASGFSVTGQSVIDTNLPRYGLTLNGVPVAIPIPVGPLQSGTSYEWTDPEQGASVREATNNSSRDLDVAYYTLSWKLEVL